MSLDECSLTGDDKKKKKKSLLWRLRTRATHSCGLTGSTRLELRITKKNNKKQNPNLISTFVSLEHTRKVHFHSKSLRTLPAPSNNHLASSHQVCAFPSFPSAPLKCADTKVNLILGLTNKQRNTFAVSWSLNGSHASLLRGLSCPRLRLFDDYLLEAFLTSLKLAVGSMPDIVQRSVCSLPCLLHPSQHRNDTDRFCMSHLTSCRNSPEHKQEEVFTPKRDSNLCAFF